MIFIFSLHTHSDDDHDQCGSFATLLRHISTSLLVDGGVLEIGWEEGVSDFSGLLNLTYNYWKA